MKAYRGNVEVVRDLLKVAIGGQTNYGIQKRTHINQAQLEKYEKPLIARGDLEKREVDGHPVYETTSKGLMTLETLNKASEIMEEIKKRLE